MAGPGVDTSFVVHATSSCRRPSWHVTCPFWLKLMAAPSSREIFKTRANPTWILVCGTQTFAGSHGASWTRYETLLLSIVEARTCHCGASKLVAATQACEAVSCWRHPSVRSPLHERHDASRAGGSDNRSESPSRSPPRLPVSDTPRSPSPCSSSAVDASEPDDPVTTLVMETRVKKWRQDNMFTSDPDFAFAFTSFKEACDKEGAAVAAEWSRVRQREEPNASNGIARIQAFALVAGRSAVLKSRQQVQTEQQCSKAEKVRHPPSVRTPPRTPLRRVGSVTTEQP